jgi:hypothetical protein
MTSEIKKDLSQEQNQSNETNGYIDPRFVTPVMGINLTADAVLEEYQQHLKDGGDKANG